MTLTSNTVVLAAQNKLEVEVQGYPTGYLVITITGTLDTDTTITKSEGDIGGSGGVITLAGIAELYIPQYAVESGHIELSVIESPIMDYLGLQNGSFSFLSGVPKIRVKSSVPLQKPVTLKLFIPTLAQLVPAGREVAFVALDREAGDGNDQIDQLAVVGEGGCGEPTEACIQLWPEWFEPVNPFDPLDPVAQVAAVSQTTSSLTSPLWKLDNIEVDQNGTPTGTSGPILVDQTDTLVVKGVFKLESSSPLPLTSEPLAYITPPPISNLLNYVNSGFGWRILNGTLDLHRAVDLQTTNNGLPTNQGGVPTTGIPVYSVLSGVDIQVDTKSNLGNVAVVDDPQSQLNAQYAHLSQFLFPASGNVSVSSGTPIALSGAEGSPAVPHLHFTMKFNNQFIDPIPVLTNDLSLFFRDQTQLELYLALDNVEIPQTVDGFASISPQNYSGGVSVASLNLQPGKQYELSLKLRAPMNSVSPSLSRLGDQLLAKWIIKLAPDLPLDLTITGSGTVSSDPQGINCPPDCSKKYPTGSTVTLTASPIANSSFAGWSGACSGSSATCTVTMDAAKTVTATFASVAFTSVACGYVLFGPPDIIRVRAYGTITALPSSIFSVDFSPAGTPGTIPWSFKVGNNGIIIHTQPVGSQTSFGSAPGYLETVDDGYTSVFVVPSGGNRLTMPYAVDVRVSLSGTAGDERVVTCTKDFIP